MIFTKLHIPRLIWVMSKRIEFEMIGIDFWGYFTWSPRTFSKFSQKRLQFFLKFRVRIEIKLEEVPFPPIPLKFRKLSKHEISSTASHNYIF